MDKKSFTPGSGWNTITFSNPPTFNGEFHIIIFINPTGTVGIGIDNNGLTYPDYMVKSEDLVDWYYGADAGDYMIRATVTYVGVEEANAEGKVELKALPNPIVDRSSISYTLKDRSEIGLKIYDAAGKLVRTLEEGIYNAGTRVVAWNAKDNNGRKVSAGIYFCKLRIGNSSVLTKALTVL